MLSDEETSKEEKICELTKVFNEINYNNQYIYCTLNCLYEKAESIRSSFDYQLTSMEACRMLEEYELLVDIETDEGNLPF